MSLLPPPQTTLTNWAYQLYVVMDRAGPWPLLFYVFYILLQSYFVVGGGLCACSCWRGKQEVQHTLVGVKGAMLAPAFCLPLPACPTLRACSLAIPLHLDRSTCSWPS